VVLFFGFRRHDGGDKSAAIRLRARRDPVIVLPLVGFGRMVRKRFARRAGHARRRLRLCVRTCIGAVRTLQAFTNEELASRRFARCVERAYAAARERLRTMRPNPTSGSTMTGSRRARAG